MDPNTLTLYFVAGLLSACLAAVMLTFDRFQPGTGLIRSWAVAVLVLAAAFMFAGIGPLRLPAWTLVIGTNVTLISAAVILHAGLLAHYSHRTPSFDWAGWLVVAATVPAFWYWGLVQPDGHARSAVFSLAVAILATRTTRLGLGATRRQGSQAVAWTVTVLFGILAAWMLARVLIVLITDAPSAALKGANPTRWPTVLGFIVMISLLAIAGMWIQAIEPVSRPSFIPPSGSSRFSFVEYFRNKLLLLWSAVVVMIVATAGMLGIAYANFYATENADLLERNREKTVAIGRHIEMVIHQADIALRATRHQWQSSSSADGTAAFIRSLPLDQAAIHNVYVIDAAGRIVISPGEDASGRNVAHRDYFAYHRDNPADRLYIAPVEIGKVTGKAHFRISRRIDTSAGGFGGVVLAAISPASLTAYLRTLQANPRAQWAVLGITDHRLRVRTPEPEPEQWGLAIEDTPLWAALRVAPSGHYENISPLDGEHRYFAYRQLQDLPLVVVAGFPHAELVDAVQERMRWLVAISLFVLACALLLSVLLTVESKRRDEQDQFMSMLSHELKTPMSVIRMALGGDGVPDPQRSRIARSVADMNSVIERCLQSDRLRHGRVHANRVTMDIAPLLKQICANSASTDRIRLSLPDTTPPLNTDLQLLDVILANLVDNAHKYSPSDSLIEVAVMPAVERGQRGIRIDVANAPGSAGMPDPEQVFRKFYRAPGAHGKTGSGLGLHIATTMASIIGASLRYRPVVNQVRFELWLPL